MELQSNRQSPPLAKPFGLYVHIPFCVHRCSYCDFYSLTQYDDGIFQKYTTRLLTEIQESAEWVKKVKGKLPTVTSLFLGGGTPSLLPLPMLQDIFSSLQKTFPFHPAAEITLEANPETVTEDFARGLKEMTPVNRVSLGAQSFQAHHLKMLERLASPESVHTAVERLTNRGFPNFSLDLIFGIPGQTRLAMLEDIERAASLKPRHLSSYNLTLKPGHTLYPQLPSDDDSAELYEAGVERLAELGYAQYEISNFSQPRYESRHNLLYWSGDDYLGLGPSAAGRFFLKGTFHHRKQLSDLGKYFESKFEDVAFEPTTSEQTILEAAFLELRRNDGVSLGEFKARYNFDLTSGPKYRLFEREGLVHRSEDRLRLSSRGRLLADMVTRDLAG